MVIRKKLILLGFIIVSPFLISAMFLLNKPSITNDGKADVTERIRLYSEGELIGEWEGIGRGQLEGNSYIFKTSRGAFREEVRIQGDFVVETFPN